MAELNFSLVIFTLLIGLCTGTFLIYGLGRLRNNSALAAVEKSSLLLMVVLLICLGVALLASATHLGKPFRFMNAFHNPGSMIAQEGLWSMALGVTLLIAALMAFKGKIIPKGLYLVGSLVSCGLLLVCSMVYVKAVGFPAWSSGVTIIYYFGSAILLGAAVVFLFSMLHGEEGTEKNLAFTALTAVFLQMIVSVAFFVHLKFGVMDVTLPTTLGMDLLRWGIGLIAPAVIAYLTWSGKLKGKSVAWSFLACVLVGEAISRVIFFMQGIHL
ncbi:DmsC/YnfH family molybdoenzyme membrane anchor subunit [Desulfitobacterium sp. PCE1]|uniref:dimethyl sulfoxide reductase anchor subunit family protein n=1 Tax=Desulfitobacterium sp. PCE1 TaxID=146907 RepID=UPI000368E865|nr:DmsC/YnfH family molybdoenzyme membrane anchor subunit [Desulfitobacterium sp. PCE1]